MGLAAVPQTSGYAVPTGGLAIRKFVCFDFDAYYHPGSKIFNIFPVVWVAADLADLTGTSVTATTYPVSQQSSNKTAVNLYNSEGKLQEWFKLSSGGETSDAYNLKEDWWVPLDSFSHQVASAVRHSREADVVYARGVPVSRLRRVLMRLRRSP